MELTIATLVLVVIITIISIASLIVLLFILTWILDFTDLFTSHEICLHEKLDKIKNLVDEDKK